MQYVDPDVTLSPKERCWPGRRLQPEGRVCETCGGVVVVGVCVCVCVRARAYGDATRECACRVHVRVRVCVCVVYVVVVRSCLSECGVLIGMGCVWIGGVAW